MGYYDASKNGPRRPKPRLAGLLLFWTLSSPLSGNVLHGLRRRLERPSQGSLKALLHFLLAKRFIRAPFWHAHAYSTQLAICRRPVRAVSISSICVVNDIIPVRILVLRRHPVEVH